ncbi:hypothetical protein KFK09_010181 [Dendrobium nobile]|uniref:Uncharacterized protein n=1 Tax=Dendrobium nobile TaxID=94219 RepID=A0A8T3BJ20_DENNO|nr:hypothetical protein KFK09_010181 [Dendrobium nobile]
MGKSCAGAEASASGEMKLMVINSVIEADACCRKYPGRLRGRSPELDKQGHRSQVDESTVRNASKVADGGIMCGDLRRYGCHGRAIRWYDCQTMESLVWLPAGCVDSPVWLPAGGGFERRRQPSFIYGLPQASKTPIDVKG